MPKKIKLEDLVLSRKPTISVVIYKGAKYFYIVGAEGERYRVASGYTDMKDANKEARRLETALDPEERARKAKTQVTSIEAEQLFNLYIKAKENNQEQDRLDEYGPSPSVGKAKTLCKLFVKFLAQWNAQPRDKKIIDAAGNTIDKITYANQITTYWLEYAWRPTWFGGKGSFWSMKKRLELVSAIWHFGQKSGFLKDQRSNKNCECTACSMMKPKKQTKTVQRTPPFTLEQYEQIVDSCALYESSFRDVNLDQLRISNKRLRAFIEVMRYCGLRIIDASLLRKDAIRTLANGKSNVCYIPVKNGDEGNGLMIPVPKHVVEQLQALPDEPGFHPDYYFWSGDSYKRNAPDPWHKALTRLWKLCPASAKEVKDKRNKKKMNPSSHMFRNTFCVQCRLHGMTYAQIADAIGDTEEMVKSHYSAYCEEYDAMIRDKVASMQQTALEQMQSGAPVEVLPTTAHVVAQANA